ncbi:MAG: hypothetical protein II453_16135 [Alphaproteobacteria bacterium]|nr:hypothetical protein [Alphaproteobacteria bacterium]
MNEQIELGEVNAIVQIPVNTIEFRVICKIYQEGQIVEVTKSLNMSETREALSNAEQYYCDPDERYALTDKGREMLKDLEKLEALKND